MRKTVHADKPDFNDYLICSGCGWPALKTVPGSICGGEVGDRCKYDCGGTMIPATEEDINAMFPHGITYHEDIEAP